MGEKIKFKQEEFELIERGDFDREKDVAKLIIWDSMDKVRKEYYFKRKKYIPKKWRDKKVVKDGLGEKDE